LRRACLGLVLGVTLAGLLAWSPLRGLLGRPSQADTPYSREHQRLLESIGTARPVAAYLSGGLSYGPYRPQPANRHLEPSTPAGSATRGEAAGAVETGSEQLSPRTALAIRRAAERHPTPENQASLAVLELIEGEPKDVEDAVDRLRKAHKERPTDPRYLNDLAAASLTLYDKGGDKADPWAALEAVDAAAQADHLEPSAPARFNLALALERLDIRVRAIAAWGRYLELDPHSDWAHEAERHRDGLKAEVAEIQASPQLPATLAANVTGFSDPWALRQLGERVLLTRWAERTLARQPAEAEAALKQAESLAGTLTPEGGRLLAASTAEIRKAERSGDQARLNLLAQGHQAFGRAFLRLREERAAEARVLIAEAIHNLQAARTPFELRARVLQAWMAEEPDWNELRRIGDKAEAGGFASIVADELRVAAYQTSLQGRFEAAADMYQESWQHFKFLKEQEADAVISVMRSELLTFLKRDQESSTELASALAAGPKVVDPSDRYSIYVIAASAVSHWSRALPATSPLDPRALKEHGIQEDTQEVLIGPLNRAALELRLEAADACYGLPERPLCAVDSALRVAALAPDADVAEAALQRAEALLPKAPSSEGKARTEIDLTVARARWLGGDGRSDGEKADAARLYGEAVKRYEARKLAVSAADARSKRAQLLKSLGHTREAVAEYRSALQAFRLWDQTDRFRPERAEKRSPAVLRNTYESLIGDEVDLAGREVSRAAFLLSEEMRDRLAPRRSAEIQLPTDADIHSFTTAVPQKAAIVEYAILSDRAVAWILAGGRLDQVTLTLPKEDLGKLIGFLSRERDKSDLEGWKSTTGALYQSLLEPVLGRLPAGTEKLVLIPDSQLYGIPFRALWDPASSQYLDESYRVSLAPSVRQYLAPELDRRVAPMPTVLPVLSVGFSTFSPDLVLNPLPRAAEEAGAIRAVYGRSARDSCQVRDWSTFLQCAPQAGVLHLATHAQMDSRSEKSWLAFERETISLDRLWQELPDLPQRPLVVLSACQSVATGGEGLGGLAGPFLASGARAVVGTLWEIDDAEAANLFIAFHLAYRQSNDAAAALSEAREDLERWEERPWIWGAVETINTEIR
jgi:CHAT domain-containing protein